MLDLRAGELLEAVRYVDAQPLGDPGRKGRYDDLVERRSVPDLVNRLDRIAADHFALGLDAHLGHPVESALELALARLAVGPGAADRDHELSANPIALTSGAQRVH